MKGGDTTGLGELDAEGASAEVRAPSVSTCLPLKDILLLRDVAEVFDLPNPRSALRFLRENSLPLVKLGRRLVVVRAALVDELRKRSIVEDRGAAVAAVVQRVAQGRRRLPTLPLSVRRTD